VPGIEDLSIEEDAFGGFKAGIDDQIKFLVIVKKFFSIFAKR